MQVSNNVTNAGAFKAGDKVKCTDNEFVEQWFSAGETYIITVAFKDGEHICFAHTDLALWHSWRFELIKEDV